MSFRALWLKVVVQSVTVQAVLVYTIDCETATNTTKHAKGVLSMAHAGRNTGGSQFFICYAPQPHLDGVHTVFGKVTKGMEFIDAVKQGDKMKEVKVFDV